MNQQAPILNYALILQHVAKDANNLASAYLNNQTKFMYIKDVINDNDCLENYAVIVVLFKITHANHDHVEDPSKQGPFKKQKKCYNHIFMFGDLLGNVCCVIGETDNQSRSSMHFCGDLIAIGQPFVLVEPKYDGSTLRKDMPVLQISNPFIPLADAILSSLPEVEPRPPSEANETSFFFLRNLKLLFVGAELRGKGDIKPPSCPSRLCDRMEPLKPSQSCGCFSHPAGNVSSVVLESTIISESTNEIRTFKVMLNRSYRTTKLFLRNPESIALVPQQERINQVVAIHQKIKECSVFINSNGGFTVSGVITRGESPVESNPNEKVVSEHATYHVCYSQPTNLSLTKSNLEFTKLQYEYDQEQQIQVEEPSQSQHTLVQTKMARAIGAEY